jgi:hypothetical protein
VNRRCACGQRPARPPVSGCRLSCCPKTAPSDCRSRGTTRSGAAGSEGSRSSAARPDQGPGGFLCAHNRRGVWAQLVERRSPKPKGCRFESCRPCVAPDQVSAGLDVENSTMDGMNGRAGRTRVPARPATGTRETVNPPGLGPGEHRVRLAGTRQRRRRYMSRKLRRCERSVEAREGPVRSGGKIRQQGGDPRNGSVRAGVPVGIIRRWRVRLVIRPPDPQSGSRGSTPLRAAHAAGVFTGARHSSKVKEPVRSRSAVRIPGYGVGAVAALWTRSPQVRFPHPQLCPDGPTGRSARLKPGICRFESGSGYRTPSKLTRWSGAMVRRRLWVRIPPEARMWL